jgi:hypothetical protein
MTEEQLDELRRSAFAIVYRMLGSVSEAEDVVQDEGFRRGLGAPSPRHGPQPSPGVQRETHAWAKEDAASFLPTLDRPSPALLRSVQRRARRVDRERGAPAIGKGLSFSQESLSWVPNAYALTFGGFLLLSGRPRVGSSR